MGTVMENSKSILYVGVSPIFREIFKKQEIILIILYTKTKHRQQPKQNTTW